MSDGTTVTDLLRLGYSVERAERDATHVLIPRVKHDALMAAAKVLAKLNTCIDFDEPVTSAVPMLFEDASGINAGFAAAHEALAALRAAGIQTGD